MNFLPLVGFLGVLLVALAAPPPPPPSPAVQKLEKEYSALLNQTCGGVVTKIPNLPQPDADNFMAAYQKFNGSGSEEQVIQLAKALLSRSDVQAFLSHPDSFGPGGLDANMVKCAVLFQATPLGLANFAVQGSTEEALISQLLGDTILMRDMLVAGGAKNGNYGPAIQIYFQLINSSSILRSLHDNRASNSESFWDSRNQSTILQRLALGTALEHATPVPHRWVDPKLNNTNVDPIARYLHYEKAYLAGDLDPALEVLTVFECRLTTDCDATDSDIQWMRDTLSYYRPDHLVLDYNWRYARSVRTEVAYGDPQCDLMPGICTGHYWQIPAANGECGPRAFFGRFSRKAFGLPTWGVTQPGHAAMTTWTPSGWEVLLGADWPYSWWSHRGEDRGGPDFYLETQCRELRADYQKALRGGWAANARGEEPVDPTWSPRTNQGYGKGGLWSALTLYLKKIAVNETSAPTRPIGPSVVPTKIAAFIARWPKPEPTPNITTDAHGTIIVPAVAYATKNRSASVNVMKTFAGGEQLLSNNGNLVDPSASSVTYEINSTQKATYYLTANFTTWHMNQDLLVSTNTSKTSMKVPVYFSVGYWNQTQPVAVDLLPGKNEITFTRTSDREMAFKEFFLYKNKPIVPPPPKNFTPSPTPPPSAYIELPADTTCLKQGLTEVPSQFCGTACAILGLKYTGAKARANMTGCFALDGGQWNGDCNFNTNKSAICNNPPCTVFGSVGRPICLRQ